MRTGTANGTNGAVKMGSLGAAELPKGRDLSERAVCLTIQTSRMGNSRRVAADDIAEQGEIVEPGAERRAVEVDADKNYLSVAKKLLDAAELRAITNFDCEVKRWLMTRALPSQFREGVYLLPLDLIEGVEEQLRVYALKRAELVDAFLDVYPARCAEQAVRLRKLGRATEYPSIDRVRTSFAFNWQYIAFSVPGQLKSISGSMWRREQEKAAKAMAEAQKEIQAVLRAAMAELVTHLVERLQPDEETGKPKTIMASSVSKLQDFLSVFSFRNLSDDAELAELVEQAKALTSGVSAKDLKQDGLRAKVAAGFGAIKGQLDTMIEFKAARKIRFAEE